MSMSKVVISNVDSYIAGFPKEIQTRLQQLREIIRRTAPGAEELISYQMPAYKQNGILVYFGAHQNHIGFYPTGSGVEAFQKELTKYTCSKGAIQFPHDQPIPVKLVEKIVRFRIKRNLEKMNNKK